MINNKYLLILTLLTIKTNDLCDNIVKLLKPDSYYKDIKDSPK